MILFGHSVIRGLFMSHFGIVSAHGEPRWRWYQKSTGTRYYPQLWPDGKPKKLSWYHAVKKGHWSFWCLSWESWRSFFVWPLPFDLSTKGGHLGSIKHQGSWKDTRLIHYNKVSIHKGSYWKSAHGLGRHVSELPCIISLRSKVLHFIFCSGSSEVLHGSTS